MDKELDLKTVESMESGDGGVMLMKYEGLKKNNMP